MSGHGNQDADYLNGRHKEPLMAETPMQERITGAPLDSYPPEDQAFFRFWYGHMHEDLMQPPLADIDHATARYIWNAARTSPADTRSERERFEAWAHSMCMSVEREPFPTRQAYLSLATSNAWEGWKGCRASLPAPTDAEWMKEAALKINRLILLSGAKIRSEGDPPEDRITDADIDRLEAELLAHLRARPAEPTPSVDVLRQCLEALERLARGFSTCPLRLLYSAHTSEEVDGWWMKRNAENAEWVRAEANSAIAALRQALEKP